MSSKKPTMLSLPAWPRLMNRIMAAAYCGSSPGHFDAHIAPHLVRLKFGRSYRYDKHGIDDYIDRQSRKGEGFDDPIKALEKLN